MSDFKDKYRLGVGKTVLDLFKKVLEKKQEIQTGGTGVTEAQGTGQTDKTQVGEEIGRAEGTGQTQTAQPALEPVKLTKVEQYYDGTIFEGTIDGDEYTIHFNMKDRTKPMSTTGS